jgi:GNAT superfamily N-acetyltransferase
MTIDADLMDLLGASWARLRAAIPAAERLGARWEAMSTAFIERVDGRAAAHAGLLWIPMVIDGQPRNVAGVHAVCTAAAQRGRGLARRVIEAALEHALARTETVLLHANDAAIYGRFGFRPLAQTVWWSEPTVSRGPAMRRLSSDDPADVATLWAAFTGRVPVSETLGVGEAALLFVMDEILACDRFARLWALDDLVIAADYDERLLQVYDVVGPRWPELDELVAHAPGRVDRVEIFFGPDRWPRTRWRTREMDAPDVLMVRGPFTAASAIAVPPMSRC